MTDAELEAEVRRLRDYLIDRGYWVINSPPECRVKLDAIAHLLGDITHDAARKRLYRYGIEPVKGLGTTTYRLRDYVLALDLQRVA